MLLVGAVAELLVAAGALEEAGPLAEFVVAGVDGDADWVGVA
jgi:hypothetical protein